MLFLQIHKHAPENCIMHNEKAKKAVIDLMAKTDQLNKKHWIKVVGGWVSCTGPEHLLITVNDAPNMEAMQKFSMEPEAKSWSACNTTEVRPAMSLEEIMKLMK